MVMVTAMVGSRNMVLLATLACIYRMIRISWYGIKWKEHWNLIRDSRDFCYLKIWSPCTRCNRNKLFIWIKEKHASWRLLRDVQKEHPHVRLRLIGKFFSPVFLLFSPLFSSVDENYIIYTMERIVAASAAAAVGRENTEKRNGKNKMRDIFYTKAGFSGCFSLVRSHTHFTIYILVLLYRSVWRRSSVAVAVCSRASTRIITSEKRMWHDRNNRPHTEKRVAYYNIQEVFWCFIYLERNLHRKRAFQILARTVPCFEIRWEGSKYIGLRIRCT